ncbi:hypothetical protein Y032_0101g3346 [Ancylostoma ceylanicum]|nr:hypothetical protein Y032_0101g3346 [Ancylostoma ceylanicum]
MAGGGSSSTSKSTRSDRAAHDGIVFVDANLGFLGSCSSHSMLTNKKTGLQEHPIEKDQPFETTYLVSEEVYTKATVRKPEKVSIWLGANVMVEYELDKAKELLEKNRGNVQKAVDELTSELAFVKDQITTTEVNIAHVHNYGVKKRQQKAAA